MEKIANIVFNPFINDSRVLKESISLSNNGYKVEVIAHGYKDLPQNEKKENFLIKRFSYLDRGVTKSKVKKLNIYLKWIKEVVSYVKNYYFSVCYFINFEWMYK